MAAAIVLAGGRSSRFGADKLRATVGGTSLLELATGAARAAGADPVLVVLAPDDDRPLPDHVQAIHDATPFDGPLAGLAAGLATLAARAAPDRERVIVVGGDMPSLVPAVLRALLAVLDDPTVDAAWLHDGERPRPLPLALRTGAAHAATRELLAAGERRLLALPERLLAVPLPHPAWQSLDPNQRTLRDIDVPTDLEG